MALARQGTYVWVSGIARLLSGESQCKWAYWFRAHFKHQKRPSEFDNQAWSIEHQAMVDAQTDHFRSLGYEVTVESQNWMRFESAGITLGARPDVIAVKGNHVVVVDCKTGQRHPWHWVQVAIYLVMVPYARRALGDLSFEGMVVYADGSSTAVAADDLDEGFRAWLRSVVREIGGEEAPPWTPTAAECSFCDIGHEDCPNRVDGGEEPTVKEHDVF